MAEIIEEELRCAVYVGSFVMNVVLVVYLNVSLHTRYI